MDNKSILVLVLILISRGEPSNNSYSLMKVLEWKFNEMNSKGILDEIKENYYAEYAIRNGIHHYLINSRGEQLIDNHREMALDFLLESYPEEAEYIRKIFCI